MRVIAPYKEDMFILVLLICLGLLSHGWCASLRLPTIPAREETQDGDQTNVLKNIVVGMGNEMYNKDSNVVSTNLNGSVNKIEERLFGLMSLLNGAASSPLSTIPNLGGSSFMSGMNRPFGGGIAPLQPLGSLPQLGGFQQPFAGFQQQPVGAFPSPYAGYQQPYAGYPQPYPYSAPQPGYYSRQHYYPQRQNHLDNLFSYSRDRSTQGATNLPSPISYLLQYFLGFPRNNG